MATSRSNGITADLEAMKRVGIGGVLIMEVDQGAPVGPADFMGPQWRELFKHVVGEAQRLGLEVNMNNDAGWNGSGGPWIKPEQAMQKVVWSGTNLTGPNHFEGALAQPEVVAGYYRDISVLAFPTPGAYRIDRIKAKAMYETGGVGDISSKSAPSRNGDPSRQHSGPDFADGQRWPRGVGCSGRQMDGAALGTHLHGGQECPCARYRRRAGMRQVEQGRDRGQLRGHDGQAGGRQSRRARSGGERAGGHAH